MTKLTDDVNSLETQATMLDRRVNETKNDLKDNVSMLDQRITQTETSESLLDNKVT